MSNENNIPIDKNTSKELLIVEYQELSNNVRVFWNLRITILGFSITIIGVLFTHLIKPEFFQKITLEVCLMFLIFALIKSMVPLTRHLIVYSLRLKEIEEECHPYAFWTRWGAYLKENSNDSNSKTITVIVRTLNIIVSIFLIIINCLEFANTDRDYEKLIIVFVCTIVIIFFIHNSCELNSKLDLNNLRNDIINKWEETRQSKIGHKI